MKKMILLIMILFINLQIVTKSITLQNGIYYDQGKKIHGNKTISIPNTQNATIKVTFRQGKLNVFETGFVLSSPTDSIYIAYGENGQYMCHKMGQKWDYVTYIYNGNISAQRAFWDNANVIAEQIVEESIYGNRNSVDKLVNFHFNMYSNFPIPEYTRISERQLIQRINQMGYADLGARGCQEIFSSNSPYRGAYSSSYPNNGMRFQIKKIGGNRYTIKELWLHHKKVM